ncbi:MAG: head-tail connector protein, partial [Candidatus Methylomirabilales bacterium]
MTPPATEPLTLAEAREHLRLIPTGSPASHPDDALITALLLTARHHLDGKDGTLGRQLITATWELVLDRFPLREIRIPLPPLQSVTAIYYDDEQGDQQEVPASDYVVDPVSSPGWVLPVSGVSWPTTQDGINAV